jgi:predicted transcriptional regulator
METDLQYDRVKTEPGGSGPEKAMPVLHSKQMSNTITVRVPEDLAEWLNDAARRTGVPKGRIIREALEKTRDSTKRPFLRLAGTVAGPADLSSRRGFSRK